MSLIYTLCLLMFAHSSPDIVNVRYHCLGRLSKRHRPPPCSDVDAYRAMAIEHARLSWQNSKKPPPSDDAALQSAILLRSQSYFREGKATEENEGSDVDQNTSVLPDRSQEETVLLAYQWVADSSVDECADALREVCPIINPYEQT